MNPEKKKTGIRIAVCLLIFLILLLFSLLLLRIRAGETMSQRETTETMPTSVPVIPSEETPPPSSLPATPEPVMTANPLPSGRGVYSERSYRLASDIAYICRTDQLSGMGSIRETLQELEEVDPVLGAFWRETMEYWYYANTEMEIHRGGLPDGLPEDDSLCIVVLGFQLLYDGGMAPELIGRCETALRSAQKYPNAYLAVTGGGTADGNAYATEAGVMAHWFEEHGISAERIIIEERSLTTDQNARYTTEILMSRYPQVRSLAVVTSDYHVPVGCLMFEEAALRTACETGAKPFAVVSNGAWATAGDPYFSSPGTQGQYLWLLADPKY